MMHTFVSFHVQPGKTSEFEAVHRKLLELLSVQPGCCDIEVHRSLSDPHEYIVHGRWQSKEAWERAHQASAEFKELFRRLPVEGHSLSRGSFFEPAYRFPAMAEAVPRGGLDRGATA